MFDAATIERMAGHFATLLEGIVAHPECAVGKLPLLTSAERHRLLVQWNDTAVDYPRDRCVHQLFEDQAARTPDAVAVVFDKEQLTYRELNARANQLAHHLIGLGVGPEALVGICLERSLELIIGLLGILKAGGAYVPLDPGYPLARLAFMLEDTQAPVLLTQQRLLGQLPPHAGCTLCLDRDWPTIASHPVGNPSATVTAASLAYVMYTSGSTGTPKGVMIEHRGVCNHLVGLAEPYRLDATDCMLQTSAISFDQSVWQIFVPLMVGARLLLPEPDAHRSPDAVVDLVRRRGVTILRIVPSLLAAIVYGPGFMQCAGLRRVFCGGESLNDELAARFASQSDAQLVNVYGPTETTVCSIYWPYRKGEGRQTIPIGSPIANTSAYVLDAHGEPVPIGTPGELYIGGEGAARGYLGQPALTVERFVADPFAQRPGARMYRTGDRARYLPDGNLEFLGRRDDQVKFRGYRIELGEIEAALAGHGAVAKSAVVVHEFAPGDRRLIAYFATNGDRHATVDELRGFLRRSLPDYMVPAAFVHVDQFPLTSGGKIDRKALPVPEVAAYASRAYEAPVGEIETALARIWADVLKIERVGRHDHFFELGGHSLLAVTLFERMRQAGLHADVRTLFVTPTLAELATALDSDGYGAPTIADLAGHISAALLGDEQDRTLAIKPQPRAMQLPLSFAQQRLWFLEQWEGGGALYNIGRGWWLQGPLEVARLREALGRLIARHESLRTVFVGTGGQPQQQVLADVVVEVPLVDLCALPVAEARAQALERAQVLARQGFDLTRAPLLRLTLIRVAESTHLLVLVMHHIVSDGWSMGVFWRELSVLYAGDGESLPALPVQYPDYAQWQRAELQDAARERQLAYWRTRLAGLTMLELPTDRPRPATPNYRGARHALALSAELSAALKQVSRREGVTLYMLLLAAFQVLLGALQRAGRYCRGQPDRRAHAPRVRGPDRFLRQHAGAAYRTCPATRAFAICSPGCGRVPWMPTRTRRCRSRNWWKS